MAQLGSSDNLALTLRVMIGLRDFRAAGHAGEEVPAVDGRAKLRILGRHSAVAAHAADQQSLFGR
jgi:hypothetical protein